MKIFLRRVYEYERTLRITERILAVALAVALDVANGLGESGLDVGTPVGQRNLVACCAGGYCKQI